MAAVTISSDFVGQENKVCHCEPLAAFEEETILVIVTVICILKFPSHLCHTFPPFLNYYWEIISPSFFVISRCITGIFWEADRLRSTNYFIMKLSLWKKNFFK